MEVPFKVIAVEHIGIAPKDPVKAVEFFESLAGLVCIGKETVEEQKTATTMLHPGDVTNKSIPRIEILDGSGFEGGPVNAFISKKGGGIHHVALRVDDIKSALQYLASQNVQLIDETPRIGAGGCQVAFIHPKSTGGVLVELVQS